MDHFAYVRGKLVYRKDGMVVRFVFSNVRIAELHYPYCGAVRIAFDACTPNRSADCILGEETTKTTMDLVDEQFTGRNPKYSKIINSTTGFATIFCCQECVKDGANITCTIAELVKDPFDGARIILRLPNIER